PGFGMGKAVEPCQFLQGLVKGDLVQIDVDGAAFQLIGKEQVFIGNLHDLPEYLFQGDTIDVQGQSLAGGVQGDQKGFHGRFGLWGDIPLNGKDAPCKIDGQAILLAKENKELG